MPRIRSTIWPIEPHTRAKHEILKNYLQGWFPILSRYSGRIVYIDGFAGPGIYSGGEEGSPLLAIRTAKDHILKPYSRAEIIFLFIESDEARAAKLREVLSERFPGLPEKMRYHVITGEFEPTIESILDKLEEEKAALAPTFAFIDPFGFTGFSMNLLRRLLRYEKCEVLVTFMAGFVKRFMDELREPALDKLFGMKEWREVREKTGPKEHYLLQLYEKQLKEMRGVKYTRSFEMIGKYNQIIYYLIFGTEHWKGLEVMKEAMWKVDRRGQYQFSDRLGRDQIFLIDFQETKFWIPEATNAVYERFKGKRATIDEIKEYVIIETPYLFRKRILRYLESLRPKRILNVIGRKKALTYPNGCTVFFSSK